MKHNLILAGICSLLLVFMAVLASIHKHDFVTPGVILFVALMYFAGRYMDKHHD